MSFKNEQNDDEIFFGKLTLKELKKHVLWNNDGRCSENKDFHNIKREPDNSIKIIETHSQPNLRSIKEEKNMFYSAPGSPALNRETAEDSFLQLENMVSELCVSPRTSDNVELNNTLEVVNYILNNGPKQKTENVTLNIHDNGGTQLSNDQANTIKEENNDDKKSMLDPQTYKEIDAIEDSIPQKDDVKLDLENKEQLQSDSKITVEFFTPTKSEIKPEVFKTPSSNIKLKTPVFKTPAPPSNKKTVTSAKKTPNRTNAYQHIASPIASYIKNCPQVPLIKDVHPKKPLPGPSSIPKYVKIQPIKPQQNKENINLPKIAYKNAKKTVLINVDEEKLPQSQWVKSTLPRPKVVKHEKREINPLKKVLQPKQEESFANLSCLQAEVSVCTQKIAFKSNK